MLLPRRLGLTLGCGLLVAGCDDSDGADAASAGASGSGAEAGSNVGGSTSGGGTAGNAGDAGSAGGTGITGGTGGSDGGSGTGGAISGGTGTTGGTSGMSGAGGTAGSAGGASGVGGTSGAAGTSDCVDFSRLEGEGGYRDLTVIGTGFDASDGETVRLVVTFGTPRNDPTYGIAETIIQSGSFEIAVRDAVGEYWGIGVYIDKGKDDACTLDDDPLWQMTTGANEDDVIFPITSSLAPSPSAPPCTINAIFDLTQPLTCSN